MIQSDTPCTREYVMCLKYVSEFPSAGGSCHTPLAWAHQEGSSPAVATFIFTPAMGLRGHGNTAYERNGSVFKRATGAEVEHLQSLTSGAKPEAESPQHLPRDFRGRSLRRVVLVYCVQLAIDGGLTKPCTRWKKKTLQIPVQDKQQQQYRYIRFSLGGKLIAQRPPISFI